MRKRSDRKRQTTIDAAYGLFRGKGFEKTSVSNNDYPDEQTIVSAAERAVGLPESSGTRGSLDLHAQYANRRDEVLLGDADCGFRDHVSELISHHMAVSRFGLTQRSK